MGVNWSEGRPTEDIAFARVEYDPALPECDARELAEVAFVVAGESGLLKYWNTLAGANYSGFGDVIDRVPYMNEHLKKDIVDFARQFLLTVSETYDERTLRGY